MDIEKGLQRLNSLINGDPVLQRVFLQNLMSVLTTEIEMSFPGINDPGSNMIGHRHTCQILSGFEGRFMPFIISRINGKLKRPITLRSWMHCSKGQDWMNIPGSKSMALSRGVTGLSRNEFGTAFGEPFGERDI